MEEYKKTAPTLWRLACALLFLVLLSMRLGTGIPARYSTSANDSDGARVAVFASDVVQTEISLSDILPGTEKHFSLTVTNQKNEKVCEVAQQYTVSVTTQNNLPLTVAIYSDSEYQAKVDTNGVVTGTFAAAEGSSATYYIKISWNSAENDYLLADEIDVVVVTVTATQID